MPGGPGNLHGNVNGVQILNDDDNNSQVTYPLTFINII